MGQGFTSALGKDSLLEETKIRLDDTLQRVRSNDPATTELDLPNCGLGPKGLTVGAPALAGNTAVKRVNISYNAVGVEGVAALTQALGANDAVSALNLAGNAIGDEGCRLLAELLVTPGCALEELCLFYNGITDKGACYLVNALQHNPALRVLNIANNMCTNATLIMMAQALQHNKNLAVLSLNGNRINPDVDAARFGTLQHDIDTQLAANKAEWERRMQLDAIKRQKAAARAQREAEAKRTKEEAAAVEAALLAAEAKRIGDMKAAEDGEAARAAQELERRQQAAAGAAGAAGTGGGADGAGRDKAASGCSAAAFGGSSRGGPPPVEAAIAQAYEWRQRMTGHGTLVKEWRNGFSVMTTRPGDQPGAPATLSPEPPRRLKACWCDPQDATAPYAKTLHYHCKYERAADQLKNDDGDVMPYRGCSGQGHTCASVGFYAKPLPDLTAAHFFALPQPPPPELQDGAGGN